MKPALSAARYFLSDQEINSLEPFGTGNVNDTFLVTLHRGKKLILQRINPAVFPDPKLVQHNMRAVTRHLDQAINNSSDLKKLFIPLVMSSGQDGDTYQDDDGTIWRLVNFIQGRNLDTIGRPSQAKELGHSLGIFHRLLSTLDPGSLTETLPGFHDTAAYLDQYDNVRLEDTRNLGNEENACHRFIDSRRMLATRLNNISTLSRCIIHGDPKVANFVFDTDSDKVISLIDLDTVRSGLLLHDIGDGLRSCCNPLGESPPVPEEIHCDPELFSAWLNGYAHEAELLLTKEDKENIVQAARVIAFELGLRFMTDHLAGDHYFKTSYPGHNLFRARVQFQLVQSIEDQLETLERIVNNCMVRTE